MLFIVYYYLLKERIFLSYCVNSWGDRGMKAAQERYCSVSFGYRC